MITHIAADDFVVFGIFNDLIDTLDSMVNICTWSVNEDDALVRNIAGLCSHFD